MGMTTSLLAGRPLTQPTPALNAAWSQHFVNGKALVDPDYSLGCSESLAWLMSLLPDLEALRAGVAEGLGRVLECDFVSLEFKRDRRDPTQIFDYGALPECFAPHLERGRDFARDTGLAALAKLDGGRGLMAVPLRGWSSPRVVALLVCARECAEFYRQDGAFVSQVATPVVNLLLGSPAPPSQARLSPHRRPTRTLSRALSRPAPKRSQPLSDKTLFHAEKRRPSETFRQTG